MAASSKDQVEVRIRGDRDLSESALQPLCLQVFLSFTEKRETASR
jgi:hypothetical protein